MTTDKKIKILVIDDSAMMRKVMRGWISNQPDMEIVAVAADPYIAVEKLKKQKPDVITLDIEMPRMDGLTFLRKLMSQHPIPVIVLSSLARKGNDVSIRAFEYGAIDVFLKEDLQLIPSNIYNLERLIDSIRAAGQSRVRRIVAPLSSEQRLIKELTTVETTDKVIVLGASTGGTMAIHDIVASLPVNTPGMVIVQHMPKAFTRDFANRLNELSDLTIKEAEDGDRVLPGKVFIAPGDKHVRIVREGAKIVIRTWDGPHINRHKPSVDVLFESAADQLGKNCIGVLLTGMGKDGAKGLLSMKMRGAFTIAQDEASSVVYGMPKEAVKLNAVDKVLPLDEIPHELVVHK